MIDDVQNLTSGAASKAWLETSDFLSIDVTADGDSYGIWMQLDALERDGEILLRDGGAENWEWCFVINGAALSALIDDVTRVSDRYPTWSVPIE